MWYNQNYLNSVTGLKLKIKIRKVGEGYGKSTQGESAGDSGMCPDNVCYNGHVIWNVNADIQRMRCVMGNADYCNDCPVFTGQ